MLPPPNSAREPRSRLQKAVTATWSISFLEASKHQARKKIEDERLARWNAGNHDSTHFFRRMGETMADTDRVKNQCKAAAKSSPARNAEEKVSLEHIYRNVEAAKTLSSFAKRCIDTDELTGTRAANLEGTLEAPHCLRHLKAPGIEEKIQQEQAAAAVKLQSVRRGQQARKQIEEIKGRVDQAVGDAVRRPQELAAADEAEPALSASHKGKKTFESAPPPPPPPPPDESDIMQGTDFAEEEREVSKTESRHSRMQRSRGSEEYKGSKASSKAKSEKSLEADLSSSESESQGDDWPPKPPILRFRAQCQFSTQFKGEEQMAKERAARKAKEDKMKQLQGGHDKIEDYTLTWVNIYFKLEIETENQFEAAFPLILLSMIDVIYVKKVRWHQVDWNAGYLHALHKNHILLENIWREVNMDKLRDFRADNTDMRIENTVTASIPEKLDFLKQVKRWFDMRVRHSDEYNPIARRTEIERQVRITGRVMKFPSWMLYDKEAVQASRAAKPEPKKRTG
eukprot:gb/GFBE01049550.1/.p1 GENE.gb/GFBE01049550.1/~~gb/GFBE01049550.1/.p1  ORF type:complete len:512 (+),score=134.76 gb/GFBE01049550.1/:1-1536(+)